MSQIIPLYIPTYISDATYAPNRVLPRLFFYNGLIECEEWWMESGSAAFGGVTYAQTAFPYFDNYNVVTGSFPTTDSLSLLFNNENASYGEIPTDNLYTEYWENYISLLYNPKTRLLNCSAIIPLKDYFEMELNDIVNFRGNYYHLRAINDYSLKDGSCTLQLLGPIIADTFSQVTSVEPTCCTPTLNTITQNETTLTLAFTLGTGDCDSCNATTIQSSTDGVNWGNNNTAGCTSPRTIGIPSVATYYRIITVCEGGNSNPSNTLYYNPNGYTITNCSTSAKLEVSFAGARPTNNVFTSSTLPNGCYSIGDRFSGSLDYTGVVNSGEYSTCEVCLTPPATGSLTFTVENPGTFPYPVTAGNGSASGTLINNTGNTIYVYSWFNSGGNTSGNTASDSAQFSGGSPLDIPFTTISGSGQTVYSTTYETIISDNTTKFWTVTKNDGLTSGATMRLGYSTTIGGTITALAP